MPGISSYCKWSQRVMDIARRPPRCASVFGHTQGSITFDLEAVALATARHGSSSQSRRDAAVIAAAAALGKCAKHLERILTYQATSCTYRASCKQDRGCTHTACSHFVPILLFTILHFVIKRVMCDVGYLCANFSLPRPLFST